MHKLRCFRAYLQKEKSEFWTSIQLEANQTNVCDSSVISVTFVHELLRGKRSTGKNSGIVESSASVLGARFLNFSSPRFLSML